MRFLTREFLLRESKKKPAILEGATHTRLAQGTVQGSEFIKPGRPSIQFKTGIPALADRFWQMRNDGSL